MGFGNEQHYGFITPELIREAGHCPKSRFGTGKQETYPKINFVLYILAEIAIVATDLAEILGMAIGLQLLTGMPLIWGVAITALDTFLLMTLQKWGMRKLEAFIIGLIFVIGMSFLVQILVADPNTGNRFRAHTAHSERHGAVYCYRYHRSNGNAPQFVPAFCISANTKI
jgi:manganese transport protein